MENILKMLGVESEVEAIAQIGRFNSLLTALKTITGQAKAEEIEDEVRNLDATAKAVMQKTEKDSVEEALGVLEAWKTANQRVAELEQKFEEIEKQSVDDAAKQSIDEACKSGKLQPANRKKAEDLYEEFGPKALEAHLAALQPGVFPAEPDEAPAQPIQGGNMPLTAEEKAVAKVCGKDEQWMEGAKKLWNKHTCRGRTGLPNAANVISDFDVRQLNKRAEEEGRIPNYYAFTPRSRAIQARFERSLRQ